MTRRPRLLDLYCGEGGAGMGYHRAGFDVVGVDVAPEPLRRYPFPHHNTDALAYLAEHGRDFDAIHASPPCQDWSTLNSLRPADTGPTGHLLPATRELLVATGLPWIMENVPGAPMPAAWRQLRRHRLFEHRPDIPLWPPYTCGHRGVPIGVYGHGGGPVDDRLLRRGFQANRAEAEQAIAAPWMTRAGLAQAIPPDYTEHIGTQLLAHIGATR